jgi:multisubunit Na+/H+ antiporter MnhB subunit
MTPATAAILGLVFGISAILLFLCFVFLLEKTSSRNRSIMKILLAVIVIAYTWIPFDGSRFFESIMLTVFAVYIINKEYHLIRKLTLKN